MKHIIHFEDINDINLLNKIIGLANTCHQFSVKYDGAPAILWGRDNQKFWISTKSFFNKTPVKFYSVKEIQARPRMAQKLKYKLIGCFNILKNYNFREEIIYHGDLMTSDELPKNNENVMHSNVLQYNFYGDNYIGILNKQIVIALHTFYFKDSLVPKTVKYFPEVKDIYFLSEFRLYRGKYISPLDSLFYKDVLDVKNQILKNLDSQKIGYDVYYSTKDEIYITTKDEGYVIKVPGGVVVKFVNRDEFTKINTQINVIRGWVK